MNAFGLPMSRCCVAACLITMCVVVAVQAQVPWNDCCAPVGPQDVSQVHITYGGRIYLSFPNYDVYLSGGPQTLGDLATGDGATDARLIYRNDQGMRWDGNEFFLHPAYPVEQFTRQRYINRPIGEGGILQLPMQANPAGGYPADYSAYGHASNLTGSIVTGTQSSWGTQLNHRPVNRLPFTGNAWVVDHQPALAPPAESAGTSPPIAPPVPPTTGRVPRRP